MPAVPAGYGAYLKSAARYCTVNVSGAAATWGAKGVTTSQISPIAQQADAVTENERQVAFLYGPIAQDTAIVRGQRSDLIGKLITLSARGNRLGYSGLDVLVVGADESQTDGTTTLTVLRRL